MGPIRRGAFLVGLSLVTACSGGGEGAAGFARQAIVPTVATMAAVEGPTAGEPRVPAAGGIVEVAGVFQPPVQVLVGGADAPVLSAGETLVRFRAPGRDTEGYAPVEVVNAGGGAAAAAPLFYTHEFSLEPHGDALDEAEAHHLYRRAGFGPLPGQVAAAVRDGLFRTVATLLHPAPAPEVEAEAAALFDAFPPREPAKRRTTQEWWLTLLRKNPNALQERMAFFWHDHFATSQRDFNDATWIIVDQIELFRRAGLGNWRDLLQEVSRDKAMLHWLDGVFSTKERPNENFARELWELFMLGEGNGYTEQDVQEAARAFTGFRLRHGADHFVTVEYLPSLHDDGIKSILGESGRFGYDGVDARDVDGGVVELTLRRRGAEAARFLCRKLFEHFVYADPPEQLVEELAEELRAADWELESVLRRLLESRAFFSARARRSQLKNPLEAALSFLRATGIEMPAHRLNQRLIELDFALLEPPQVSGWPPPESFLGEQAMVGYLNFLTEAVSHVHEPRPAADPVGDLARELDLPLTPVARDEMNLYLEEGAPDGVAKRRGLLFLMGQYHEAFRK